MKVLGQPERGKRGCLEPRKTREKPRGFGKNRRAEKTCHLRKSLVQEMKKPQKVGPTGRKG